MWDHAQEAGRAKGKVGRGNQGSASKGQVMGLDRSREEEINQRKPLIGRSLKKRRRKK